jgi:hypothetical protein
VHGVRIDRFHSRTQAELAASFLEAHGIAARVRGDDAGGVHPAIPYGIGGTVVEVDDERGEEALALLGQEFGVDANDRFPAELEGPDAPDDGAPPRRRGVVLVAALALGVTLLALSWWNLAVLFR